MSPRPLAEEIAEVLRLDSEATKQPWRECGADRGGCMCATVWSEGIDLPVARASGIAESYEIGEIPESEEKTNARLIARYRTAAPRLARALERLTGEDFRLLLWQRFRGPFGDSQGEGLADMVQALIKKVAEEESHG